MKNHMRSNEIMVENGTAPLLDFPHIKKFKNMQVVAIIDGYKVAVNNAARFHSRPFMVLYSLAEKYPAIRPIKTYRNIATVIKAPLEAGDNIPSIAKTVKNHIICKKPCMYLQLLK